jgi:hemoglobin/transferrin/lactoferrin receptor protein
MVGATSRHRSDYRDGNGNIVPNSAFDVRTEIAKLNLHPAEGHDLKFGGIHYETNYTNGLPNATHTATVYGSEVTNDLATARWIYKKPDDHIFNFDINTYWTSTNTTQTKIDGTNNSPSSAAATCDNARCPLSRTQGHSRGAVARSGRKEGFRYSTRQHYPSHALIQCRQSLRRLSPERGRSDGARDRKRLQ